MVRNGFHGDHTFTMEVSQEATGEGQWELLRRELESLPQAPVSRRHPRNWIFRVKRAADFMGHSRHKYSQFWRQANPYPRPFRHVTFRTEDGVQISAWYGPPHDATASKAEKAGNVATSGKATDKATKAEKTGHAEKRGKATDKATKAEKRGHVAKTSKAKQTSKATDKATKAGKGRPRKPAPPPFGLVIVPGMFSSKDDTVHKRRTIHIWRHWKIPVLCIDMRAFGESTGIATGGWKEALDVHGAVRFLHDESGAIRIGVVAESMGGAAALNALAHDSRSGTDLMTGGVLTWSTYLDARDAVQYISAEPPAGHPYHTAWAGFRKLLSLRSMGGYESFAEYMADAARVNGLASVDELYDLANPKWKIAMMHGPVLCVHAANDPVVPVRHARRMERYARDHPHIQVLVVPWGQHTGFEAMDPVWFWEVTRRFFGGVNGMEFPNLARGFEAKVQA